MGDHALTFNLKQQTNWNESQLHSQDVLDGGGQGRSRDIFDITRYHVIKAKIVYYTNQ